MKLSCPVCRCPCRGMQFSLRMKRRMCPWCAYNSQYVKREDGERECSTCCTPLAVCVVVWLGESRSPKVMCFGSVQSLTRNWKSHIIAESDVLQMFIEAWKLICRKLSRQGRVTVCNWTFNWFLDSNLKIVFKMFVIFIIFFSLLNFTVYLFACLEKDRGWRFQLFVCNLVNITIGVLLQFLFLFYFFTMHWTFIIVLMHKTCLGLGICFEGPFINSPCSF